MISVMPDRYDTDDAWEKMAWGGVGDLVGAHPPIIKVMTSTEQLKWAHGRYPDAIYVYRDIGAFEEPFNDRTPSREFAEEYWRAIKPQLKGLKFAAINVWPNEPGVDFTNEDGTPNEQFAKEWRADLDDYFSRLCELARADGVTLAIGAFSAEARLWDKWHDFQKTLTAIRVYGHWLDLHGYAPDFNDAKYEEFLYPWRDLRTAMKLAGQQPPNILCGEFGVDSNLFYGVKAEGYRDVISNETYADWLLRADRKLRADNVPAVIYLATRANCPDDQIMYNILLDDSKRHEPKPSVWERIKGNIADTWKADTEPAPEPAPPPPVPPPVPQTSGPRNYRVTGTLVVGGWVNLWEAQTGMASGGRIYEGKQIRATPSNDARWAVADQPYFVTAQYLKEI